MAVTTVFEQSTGKILRVTYCPEDMLILQSSVEKGEAQLDGVALDPTLQYISSGAVVDRPECEAAADGLLATADGVDEIVITGIPNPSTVLVSGEDSNTSQLVEDGQVEVTFDVAGNYTISVLPPFPMKPKSFAVEAV